VRAAAAAKPQASTAAPCLRAESGTDHANIPIVPDGSGPAGGSGRDR
jgi:hypothetical protein